MDVRQGTTPEPGGRTFGVLMSSPEVAVSTKQVRAYRLLAMFVAVGLVVAFVIGAMGVTGPGVLTPESAFLVAGLAILVVAAALLYVLITYRNAFTRLQVQHAMLKALENDLRKTAQESQALARQSAADRARIAGLEPRVGQTAALADEVSQRVEGLDGRYGSLKQDAVALGRDLETVKDDHRTLQARQATNDARLVEFGDRLEGIEYETMRTMGETVSQLEWLQSENIRHAERDSLAATRIEETSDAVGRFEEHQGKLEARVAAVESEADSRDHRFDALDQRLAVVELEVATAPRLTRTLETRVVQLEKDVDERFVAAAKATTQNEPEPPSVGVDVLAHLAAQTEETARLADEVGRVAQTAGAHGESLSQLERRVTATEVLNTTQEEEIRRIANGLAEHEKHFVPVTVADLRMPTIVPARAEDDLAAIEGIGSVFRARLRENGVGSYQELRAADAEGLAPKIGTRAKTIRGWQAMAELMQIPGIDNQVAELLVRVGITNREGLAQTSPRTIVERVRDYNERHEIPLRPALVDDDVAKKWVDAAQPKLVATMG